MSLRVALSSHQLAGDSLENQHELQVKHLPESRHKSVLGYTSNREVWPSKADFYQLGGTRFEIEAWRNNIVVNHPADKHDELDLIWRKKMNRNIFN